VSQAQAAGIQTASAGPANTTVITLTDDGPIPAFLTIAEHAEVIWRNTTSQAYPLRGATFYPVYLPLALQRPGSVIASHLSQSAHMSRAAASASTIFSTTLQAGGTFTYTFASAGQFAYFRDQADQPLGRIQVQPGSSTINISIVRPKPNAMVGDQLSVVATTTSLYELVSLAAEVNGRTSNLSYVPEAYCDKFDCHPGWSGNLTLAGLARGAHTLTVTATNVFSDAAVIQVPFVYDRPPELTVLAPLDATVARPQIHVAATCDDDDAAGCEQIAVAIRSGDCYSLNSILASGQSSINTTIPLATYDGRELDLCIRATDSAGNRTIASRRIYVEASSALTEVISLNGPILDVQPDRVLYLDTTDITPTLKIRQLDTGQDIEVATMPVNSNLRRAYLTPVGALVPYSFLPVKGNYTIGENGRELIRRDLVLGTNTVIISDSIRTWNGFDVAANGDVIYTSGTEIFRYHDGTTTRFSDNQHYKSAPRTDGINIVYRKSATCSCGPYSTVLFTETAEIILAPAPGGDYQLNNGWIAFTKAGADGSLQVWTRSPAGDLRQVSFFGTSSFINALGPNGDVTFINRNRLYLSRSGAPAVEISSNLGRSFWQDGQWFVIIGRSLFKVEP
jgi:hypothetical protein